MKYNTVKRIIVALFLLLFGLLCVWLFKAYLDGHFHSQDTLQAYIAGFGIWGPIVLTLIQTVQVVFPVLPGFLGCIVGALLFGPTVGFLTNYIGISLGSLIAFLLARKFGRNLVNKLFPGKRYQRIMEWAAESKSYSAILFAGTVLPLFPDDFFCYFSGITKMTFCKFAVIIILGKPWCILLYSLFPDEIFDFLVRFFHWAL